MGGRAGQRVSDLECSETEAVNSQPNRSADAKKDTKQQGLINSLRSLTTRSLTVDERKEVAAIAGRA